MEAASHVGMINQGNQLFIWAALEVAVSLPQVNVNLHRMFAGRHCECLV
jgi:hypothetical protein